MRETTFPRANREISKWSEPLVADHIYGEYERLLGGRTEHSEALGRQHFRMWRNLLGGKTATAEHARRELLTLARGSNLQIGAVEAIDAAIFRELLSLILRRGHGSLDAARTDGMVLVQAASTLGEIRKAA
jgi:hypothetical protein